MRKLAEKLVENELSLKEKYFTSLDANTRTKISDVDYAGPLTRIHVDYKDNSFIVDYDEITGMLRAIGKKGSNGIVSKLQTSSEREAIKITDKIFLYDDPENIPSDDVFGEFNSFYKKVLSKLKFSTPVTGNIVK